MGVSFKHLNTTGEIQPMCSDCGVALCWSIYKKEYYQYKHFWDNWLCETCNPNYKGAYVRYRAEHKPFDWIPNVTEEHIRILNLHYDEEELDEEGEPITTAFKEFYNADTEPIDLRGKSLSLADMEEAALKIIKYKEQLQSEQWQRIMDYSKDEYPNAFKRWIAHLPFTPFFPPKVIDILTINQKENESDNK